MNSVLFNDLTMEENEMQENKTNGATEMTDYSINADENAAGRDAQDLVRYREERPARAG